MQTGHRLAPSHVPFSLNFLLKQTPLPSTPMIFLSLLRHELRLQLRRKSEGAALILFFLILLILMPFALGPDPVLLARVGPGIVWIATLLMALLSLDRLFVQDARDGSLDEMLTAPVSLEKIVAAKLLAQSLVLLGALLVMSLPALIFLGLKPSILPILGIGFALGVPSLVLLGGLASALTVALHRSAALLTLLLIPFYLPVLIFAVSACEAQAMGAETGAPLLFLGAILTLLLPSTPFIIAASLRHNQG